MKLISPANDVTLSIIVPVYNEVQMLPTFHHEVLKTLATLPNETFELVYVNDGSKDSSWLCMQSLSCPLNHCKIRCINLSRNFGKEAAMTAGLDHATGQAIIFLDADLQDPPELIPQMLAKWREGFDVVNMKRKERVGESAFKKFSAFLYYRLLTRLSDVELQQDVGDFRLLSRRVVDAIKKLPERNRYMKGILSWPGFVQTTLTFDRPARVAGDTKWSFLQLVGLGLSGITSFSVKPLRLATWAGGLVSASAFFYAMFVVFKTLFFGESVAGYPTMMLVILMLGGLQLLAIGVVGEYIARIFTESKGRPIYIVMDNEVKIAQEQAVGELNHG
ncbi:MAG: glycosyltransferase family 2 protein [Psychrobium sp.]